MTDHNTTQKRSSAVRKALAVFASASALAMTTTAANAAGTLAGTDIVNVAQASEL